MNQNSLKELIAIPPFNAVGKNSLKLIEKNLKTVKFEIGQELIEQGKLPGCIYIVKSGSARFVSNINGRVKTIDKYSPGDFIGIASLITGEPLENVYASDSLIAFAFDESVIESLYNNDSVFKSWIDNQLFLPEVVNFTKSFSEKLSLKEESFNDLLSRVKDEIVLIDSTKKSIDSFLRKDYTIFNASSWNTALCLYEQIRESKKIKNNYLFNIRLICIPNNKTASLRYSINNPKLNPADDFVESNNHEIFEHTPISKNSVNKDFKLIRAKGSINESLACLQMLAKAMNIPIRRDSLEKLLQEIKNSGVQVSLKTYGQIIANLGLHVIKATVNSSAAIRLQTPSLIIWKNSLHMVIESNSDGIKIASPREGIVQLSIKQISEDFAEGIEYLMVERSTSTPEDKFGVNWFFPALSKYKSILFQVLCASFFVQLFTLANPLLIQVIIDKVISQRSLDTLQVLGIALLILTLVEGILGSFKTFLFVETTNRIDQRLGSEVIDHLLRLPLNYFDKRPVGELGTRVAELEKIRNFITGQGLNSILDAAFSVVYIVVMLFYSITLTLIALSVLPIQVFLTVLGAPIFRKQFREAAEDNARTQSHLVEVITGIQTVKAQNIETTSRWKWQEFYSKYITTTFRKTITGTVLTQTSQVLQKISQLLVLWIGASMVLDGRLTLGQLIAFRIISGYVTQPILRLSTIWQNIQELRISFERLGDVINTTQESDENDKNKIPLPSIIGSVTFENIDFEFSKGSNNKALENVNLEIEKGTFVGIVGQSGSGKSTLMKLLSRLYSPTNGKIIIDGYDIDKVELYSLRRQIGIVPQEPLLFAGTISENIALDNEESTNEEIVNAAKLASAHDFIMQLPFGYSTKISERGSSLSGGQRQRIAIARTLLSKPKILIFDEATSALDYQTESLVVNNIKKSFDNTTVFFITHRLPTVSNADLIIMMEQGSIIEKGTHSILINEKGSYFSLYKQQEGID